MQSSNTSGSSSPCEGRALTPSSRVSDEEVWNDALDVRRNEHYWNQRASSPVNREKRRESPPSFSRAINSSPLAYRSAATRFGSTNPPRPGSNCHAFLSPTFPNRNRSRNSSPSVHPRRIEPSHLIRPHSHFQSRLQPASPHLFRTPLQSSSPQSSTSAHMTSQKPRSFWDPRPEFTHDTDEDLFQMGQELSGMSASVPDGDRGRRKRTFEDDSNLRDASSKSLRPSPAIIPGGGTSVSDPFELDLNDPLLADLLGGDPSADLEEMKAMQRSIEEDAKLWKKRNEEREQRDREFALSLHQDLNSSPSSGPSASGPARHSVQLPSTPNSAGESSRSVQDRVATPHSPREPNGSYVPQAAIAGSSTSRNLGNTSGRIKAEPSSRMNPSASWMENKDPFEFVVLSDDDEPGPSRNNVSLPAPTVNLLHTRPATAASTDSNNEIVMDLTGFNSETRSTPTDQPPVPGAWDSSDLLRPSNSHSVPSGFSLAHPLDRRSQDPPRYKPSPYSASAYSGYHGAANTSVYGGSHGNGIGATSSRKGIHMPSNASARPSLGGHPMTGMPTGYAPNRGLYGSADYPFPFDVDYQDPDHEDYLYARRQNPEEVAKQLQDLMDNISDPSLGADDRTGSPEEMADGAALYKHQVIGLKWMSKMEEGSNKGGILADDMGLGKTIQAIALIVSRRSQNPQRKTNLIVAPVALLSQWKSELEQKVKPEARLSVFIYHGSHKGKGWRALRNFDVVLTTYGTLASELRRKEQIDMMRRGDPQWQPLTKADHLPLLGDGSKWYRVILDEAQNIKNKNTKNAKAAHCLQAKYRHILTGTPMMNSLTELYSLIKFLQIRPYCEWEKFRNEFDKPMRARSFADMGEVMRKFQALLKAILLRRTKQSKIDGQPIITLPPRITMIDHAVFDEDQQAFYDNLESQTQKTFNRYLARGTVGKHYSNMLELLLRLRQACDHPHLIKNHAEKAGASGAEQTDPDALVKLATDGLTHDAIERIKLLEFLECSICIENAGNATIFTPCGHFTCTECFTRVSDPATATHHNGVDGGETFKFTCMNCRGPVDPRRVTDYSAFRRAHMPDAKPTVMLKEADTHEIEDFDIVTDDEESSDDESDNDSDDEFSASLKDFINDDSEDQAPRAAASAVPEVPEDNAESDDDSDAETEPMNEAEFLMCFEEGEAYKAREMAKAEAAASVKSAKDATKKEGSESGADSDNEDVLPMCSTRAASRQPSNVNADAQVESETRGKSKKGKGKRHVKKYSLSELAKESRRSIKARQKYKRLLKKRWITSAKIEKCMEILRDIREKTPGEKTIVFSQFTTFLDLIEIPIDQRGWLYKRYDGSMSAKARTEAVEDFKSQGKYQIMLVSLKAGNAGLNLTAANNIVLLDPFWNPYIEEQAIDRAHRIGQRRQVNIHRILIEGTVEDRIIALQEKKRELIEGALDEEASKSISRLSVQDLGYLFGIKSRP